MTETMPTAPGGVEAAVQRTVQFFEQLQPADLGQLGRHYAADAVFKDPFNEVRGLPAIEAIFRHMFVSLHEPHFIVTQRVVQGAQCFLTWDFVFRFQRFSPAQWQTVRGASHLVYDEQGLITLHRDYWDAAEELYEKLPVLGSVMRWLKQRARE